MGFGVPLAKWFRGPLKERVRSLVSGGSLVQSGLFNQDYLQKLVDQHLSGSREHSAVIWSLLMFDASFKKLGFGD
jgi:asparagine synthase (glutamine-hydrolysing)